MSFLKFGKHAKKIKYKSKLQCWNEKDIKGKNLLIKSLCYKYLINIYALKKSLHYMINAVYCFKIDSSYINIKRDARLITTAK